MTLPSSMPRARRQAGFSLLELMIVVAVALIIAAFAVPNFLQAMRNFRIAGDAQSINSEILLAKMRAAANFTRARVQFDFTGRTFRSELWNRDASTWDPVAVGAPQVLSQGVNFDLGIQTDPPAGTQAALGQAPICKEGAAGDPGGGADIVDTACIIFNSRGFPVDDDGSPTTENAIYIANLTAVHGVTVGVTGITRVWRHDGADSTAAGWFRD